jgi:hypothetical protein
MPPLRYLTAELALTGDGDDGRRLGGAEQQHNAPGSSADGTADLRRVGGLPHCRGRCT